MVKPKNFTFPFSKDSASVLLHEGVFFIPPQVKDSAFSFPGWEACFQQKAPIHVEFCSGNGSWIAEKAKQFPTINWVAVEKRFDRVRKIWAKAQNEGLTNLLVVFGDARVFLHTYMPTLSVAKLFINFPDPWPKRRHTKHKIISEELFEGVCRVLEPQGHFVFVTDDAPYSSYFDECTHQQTSRFLCSEETSLPEGYGTSFFHSLFVSQGKTIHYHELVKKL